MNRILPFVLFSCLLYCCNTPPAASQSPEELGRVDWLRDFDKGLERAEAEQKPVFLLFQEVPGCSTCRRYGQEVLSHPLIVEAIETYFVPVAIYNNRKGKDAEVLQYFEEPSWNNPVVRIVNQQRADVVPRLSGNYTPSGVVSRISDALELRSIPAPTYLQLLQQELEARSKGTEAAVFSMYCFWKGEQQYGQIEGVISTEPGFMDGREVVKLIYDPTVVSYAAITEAGQKASCADGAYTHGQHQAKQARQLLEADEVRLASTFRPDEEPKYYLSKTPYRAVPMTSLQAARANALIGQAKSPDKLLSARQLRMAEQAKAAPKGSWENRIGQPISEAWPW